MSIGQYGLYPVKHRKARSMLPEGWVKFSQGMNTRRRPIDDAYMRERLPPRNTNIAARQHYVLKVLNNPRTPPENRDAVIGYVSRNPDYFDIVRVYSSDPATVKWGADQNAGADPDFLEKFARRYLGFAGER